MSRVGQTPSQTVGPFFSMALIRPNSGVLAGPATPGEHIRVEGLIYDADRNPIEDALIEVWQANREGRYRHPDDDWDRDLGGDDGFTGFGRAATATETGLYRFDTIKPGPVPDAGGRLQSPHLNLTIFARGMLAHSYTRMYFPDEERNHSDALLRSMPDGRRATLIASPGNGGDLPTYRFDIRFQGEDETVFLDV